jgi:hypothetical protein
MIGELEAKRRLSILLEALLTVDALRLWSRP